MYGSEADIYLNLDSDEIATIPNSVGSRQGCSLGSFLFCLALQPVINQLQAEFPDLLILAYCDDVMICGEASRAIKALERYGQLLHTVIQMELRPDKTDHLLADHPHLRPPPRPRLTGDHPRRKNQA